jgi:hypothetical protein
MDRQMPKQKVAYAFRTLRELFDTLCDDVILCRNLAQNSPSMRRAYVRSVFALIEGVTFELKQVCLDCGPLAGAILSDEEKALLADHTYDLTQQGQPRVRAKFIPIDANFRFAMATLGRVLGLEFTVSIDGPGWSSFKNAIAIRNRITHPKSSAECEISDADFQTVAAASDWFRDAFVHLGQGISADDLAARVDKPDVESQNRPN